jgi:hypothetical protein
VFASGQSVHYWESPATPAVLCRVLWEGVYSDREGAQIYLLQEAATGRRFAAKETRLSAVPLEVARPLGICPTCQAQPCLCATRQNPNWVAELDAEVTRLYGPEVPRE